MLVPQCGLLECWSCAWSSDDCDDEGFVNLFFRSRVVLEKVSLHRMDTAPHRDLRLSADDRKSLVPALLDSCEGAQP